MGKEVDEEEKEKFQDEAEEMNAAGSDDGNKNAGARPWTAYLVWFKKRRKEIKASEPEITFGDLTARTEKEWGTVPQEEKVKCQNIAKTLNKKLGLRKEN